jgi:hypothetical protein
MEGIATIINNGAFHTRFPLRNPPPVGEGINESLREIYDNDALI